MSLFVLTCIDRKGALDVRMATRPAHLDYVGEHAGKMKLVGPLLDDEGGMAGSMFIMEAQDKAEVEAFAANDPYALAGVFERTEIRGFKVVRGTLG